MSILENFSYPFLMRGLSPENILYYNFNYCSKVLMTITSFSVGALMCAPPTMVRGRSRKKAEPLPKAIQSAGGTGGT